MSPDTFKYILQNHDRIAIVGGPQVGKAQPIDSVVISEHGERPIGAIKKGDYVASGDGNMTLVTGVFPQGILPTFRIYFNDDTSAECCENHLWIVRGKSDRSTTKNFRVVSTRDIIVLTLGGNDRDKRMYIPTVRPVRFRKRKLLLDPYFMGILIGDGGLTGSPRLSSADKEIIQSLVLPDGVYCDKIPGDNVDYYLTTRQRGLPNLVSRALRQYNLSGCNSHQKFIPQDYLLSNAPDRLALLQGLMDSDGWAQGVSSYFCSVSERLCKDVQWLAQSLGIWARLATKHGRYQQKDHISFRVTLSSDNTVFRLHRKKSAIKPRAKPAKTRAIKWVEYARDAECVCISTEAGNYCTNGFVVTHNTTLAKLTKDRPVFHNDDGKHLDWEAMPQFIKDQVHGHDKFVVEGVHVARALRKGLLVDAVIHLDQPHVDLKPGQKSMHKGHAKILKEALLVHPPVAVYR